MQKIWLSNRHHLGLARGRNGHSFPGNENTCIPPPGLRSNLWPSLNFVLFSVALTSPVLPVLFSQRINNFASLQSKNQKTATTDPVLALTASSRSPVFSLHSKLSYFNKCSNFGFQVLTELSFLSPCCLASILVIPLNLHFLGVRRVCWVCVYYTRYTNKGVSWVHSHPPQVFPSGQPCAKLHPACSGASMNGDSPPSWETAFSQRREVSEQQI